jgi:hypothetical protein
MSEMVKRITLTADRPLQSTPINRHSPNGYSPNRHSRGPSASPKRAPERKSVTSKHPAVVSSGLFPKTLLSSCSAVLIPEGGYAPARAHDVGWRCGPIYLRTRHTEILCVGSRSSGSRKSGVSPRPSRAANPSGARLTRSCSGAAEQVTT